MSTFGSVYLKDPDGAPYGVKHVNNKPRVSAMPYLYDIAEGNVTGHIAWSKTGYNPDVDTTNPASTGEDIWAYGGTYVFPTAEMGMEVVSSSADDDGDPAGTGVQVVTIKYLDDAGAEHSEDVTLNGTGVVATVATDIYRIQNFRVKTVGAGKVAAGNIDIRHIDNTPVYSRIALGQTRARNSTWTVPADKVLYITSMSCSCTAASTGKDAIITLLATYDDVADSALTFFMPFAEIGVQDGAFTRDFELPIKFQEGTDIKVRAVVGNDNSICIVSLRGWLETA